MKSKLKSIRYFALLFLLTGPISCTQKAKVDQYLTKANAYFDAGDYESAEIEYKNVLQVDSRIPEAVGNLGLIYYRQGRVRQAYPFLTLARDIDPDNLTFRQSLGSLLLEAGDSNEAWEEALSILEKGPSDPVAPLILAAVSPRLGKIVEAREKLDTLSKVDTTPSILVALGLLDAQEGNLDIAEAQFRKAIELDPTLSDAHIALGKVLWARQEAEAAEASFLSAYENAGKSAIKQFRYIQFKATIGDRVTASRLLETLLQGTPSFVPGLYLKSQMLADEKNLEEATKTVEKILRLDPYHIEAILLSANLKIRKGENDDAVKQLERLTEIYPGYAMAHYQLALAYLVNNQPIKSSALLTKTLAIDPTHNEAILMQAALNARQGEPENAIVTLENLLKTNPDNIQAKSLLAQILLAENDLEDALELYQSLATQLPNNPQPMQMVGDILLQMGNREAAHEALESSLNRNSQYLPAFERLTDLYISEKRFDEALGRIDAQLVTYPNSEILHFLKGKVLFNQSEGKDGEASIKKALELQPTFRQAHILLASYYIANKQTEQSIQQLSKLAEINPEDTAILLQIGTLQEQQGNYDLAIGTYQQILSVNPDHGPALNNIAYLKSEFKGDIEEAYELAVRAKSLLPNDPSISDTLGWINYKKGDYDTALRLLKASATALEHPMVQYHLGKIHQAREEINEAKTAMERAISLGLDDEYVDDAKSVLELGN